MEEISLKELFDCFKANICIIIMVILTILMVGNYYSFFIRKPLYKSDTTVILVNENNSINNNYSSSDIQLNRNLVSTYSEIIKSRKVLKTVIQNLGLSTTVEELHNNISVSSVADTEIIKITVSDLNAQKAASIADEIARDFSREVESIYNLENVSIVDTAIVEDTPYNTNYVKDNVIYFAIGAVLSCAIVFIKFYFDTTIKSEEEIEQKLGLTVLGIVPDLD